MLVASTNHASAAHLVDTPTNSSLSFGPMQFPAFSEAKTAGAPQALPATNNQPHLFAAPTRASMGAWDFSMPKAAVQEQAAEAEETSRTAPAPPSTTVVSGRAREEDFLEDDEEFEADPEPVRKARPPTKKKKVSPPSYPCHISHFVLCSRRPPVDRNARLAGQRE